MSHNTEPGSAAGRHVPALIAIAVALIAAFLAFLVFRPGLNEQNEGIATTPVVASDAVQVPLGGLPEETPGANSGQSSSLGTDIPLQSGNADAPGVAAGASSLE